MSTCHQSHNIPWNSLLEVLHKEPSIGNQPLSNEEPQAVTFDLRFKMDDTDVVFKKLRHFASKVESTVKEFAQTERKKYSNERIDGITKVYEDSNCNEWLAAGKLQDLSGWDELKQQNSAWCYRDHYVEAVKELFIQEKIDSLLFLARKGIQLEALEFVTYSNFFHYGIGRIKEDCLTLYIHLNLLLANHTLQNPSEWHGQWKRFLQGEILTRYDGNSQSRMYKEYFEKNPNFEDLEALQELLKKLFKMMYTYDMVMNERGKNISWKKEVLSCLGYFLDRTREGSQNWWNCLEKERQDEN